MVHPAAMPRRSLSRVICPLILLPWLAHAEVDAPATSPDPSAAPNKPAHPFRVIPSRNAFRIQPPPPPPLPVEEIPKTPPPPPSNVTLTGFSVWKGRTKVYLQVATPGGKAPDYLTMEEGQTQNELQIVSIDPRNESVKVINAGQEMTLNFKEHGAKGTGTPPGQPGAPNAIPAPVATALAANATPRAGAGPTVIGKGGITDGGIDPLPGSIGANGAASANFLNEANAALANLNNSRAAIPTAVSPVMTTIAAPGSAPGSAPSTAPIVAPGQTRIINGVTIPAPPPLPFQIPTPNGN